MVKLPRMTGLDLDDSAALFRVFGSQQNLKVLLDLALSDGPRLASELFGPETTSQKRNNKMRYFAENGLVQIIRSHPTAYVEINEPVRELVLRLIMDAEKLRNICKQQPPPKVRTKKAKDRAR